MTPQNATSLSVGNLQVEHLRETLGIGVACPRLSWMVETGAQNWRQAAYEIEASDPDSGAVQQTGRVESDQSVLVAWPFAALKSR